MSLSFTHLSWWLWSGKNQEPKISNGSSLNSLPDSGLWELDTVKFPLVNGGNISSSSRRVKRKWQSREQRKIDREFDVVVVPSDGGCVSGSESDDSDWSVGWLEPLGPGFRSDDDSDDNFAVLVRCYGRGCVNMEENLRGKSVDTIGNVPDIYAAVQGGVLQCPLGHQEKAQRSGRFTLPVCIISQFVAACKKPPLFCIITEYLAVGSLRKYLHQQEPYSLPLNLVLKLALDIARGMQYLHSLGILHRDLKSENLLLGEDMCVKVADFGISCLESQCGSAKGFTSTYHWMAPEMIKEKHHTKKVDVYSFGIVLWELLTVLTPFDNMTPEQAAFAVCQKSLLKTFHKGFT